MSTTVEAAPTDDATTLTPASFREALTPAELAFEQRRRRFGLGLAPLVFLLLWLLPFPGLTPEAHRFAAILAFTVILWVTEAVPLPVSGILGVALSVILGVEPAREALAPFADHLVFLLIGGFIMAEAIFVHGLNRRFAFGVLSLPWVGARPARVLVAYAAVTAFISMWVSNTASTALMLPIGLSLLEFLYTRRGAASPLPDRNYATGLMLVTAFAASLGGLGTPIGTPTNLIGMGFLEEQIHRRVSFFEWVLLALPILVILMAVTLVNLNRSCPAGLEEVHGGRRFILTEKGRLGPLSGGERNVLAVFALAIFLWTLPGFVGLAGFEGLSTKLSGRFPEGIVALLCASLLFFLPTDLVHRKPTLQWNQAARIDWGTVLLLGSGIALGRMAERTGLSREIGQAMAAHIPQGSLLVMLLVSTLAAVLISETTSNMASVTMLVPLVISVSQGAGVDPVLPALGATMGGSLGFMLPVSTPPNALVYGSGYVPIARMVKHGLVLDVAGVIVVVGVLYFLGPLVIGS
ncbi:MAG TPA: DASS family sodium-coupled anion symporter [Candidatus Eisenbacteria bacterium]